MEELIILLLFIFIFKIAISILKDKKRHKYRKKQILNTYQQPTYKPKKPFWKNNYSFQFDYSYMPYKKANLLTKTEHVFFVTLVREALKRKLLVCPKVRLEDLAYVPEIRNREKYRGYIKSRHIDFALINLQCETVAAIELDDPSHDEEEATKTDQFKDELFKAIDIPLIRIKTGTDYITQLNAAFNTYNLGEPLQKP